MVEELISGAQELGLELSDAQAALFRAVNGARPRVAVLLFAGRPLAVPTLAEQARAILCMWQPGTEGGSAAARLLLGDAEPGGRLAMSFPRATGQEPVSYDVLSTGRPTQDWKNPDNNTYQTKWLDCPVAPLYPFGWGLGYTDFTVTREALSAAALRPGEALKATCRVTNVGKRAGTTVVQLYIRDLVGSRARPLRQLKGFEKVALGPGESLEVRFEIDEPMLRFTTLERGYASEKGRFEVFLALNSESGRPLSFTLE